MKNTISKFGFLGLIGFAGLLLGGRQLLVFFLFFLLFFLCRTEQSKALSGLVGRAFKASSIAFITLYSSIFLISSVVKSIKAAVVLLPLELWLLLLVKVLSWAFVVCIAVFIFYIVIGAVIIHGKKNGTRP
jgi:hypothetical protein